MNRSALWMLAALLASSITLAAPTPPLCRVQVTAAPHELGRLLTIRTAPGCPPGGVARVRLASHWGGSLPDTPPGAYTLRPGMTLRRVALPWWRVEWLAASGRAYPVPEGRP